MACAKASWTWAHTIRLDKELTGLDVREGFDNVDSKVAGSHHVKSFAAVAMIS